MTIKDKKTQILVAYDKESNRICTDLTDKVTKWCKKHDVSHCCVNINEEKDWDRAPMRNFFHAVVLPAYVKKYNETHGNPHLVFQKGQVKQYLKVRFLGFIRDYRFDMWNQYFDLENRPVDMQDWFDLTSVLSELKEPPEPVSSESISPERYWRWLRDLEAYYLALFNDMYDIRQKPAAPDKIQ